MTTYNVVRFRVKEGMDQAFLDAHRDGKAAWPGLTRASIIKTGERTYVLIGEWPDMATLAGARERMIATLDTFRHSLEEFGTWARHDGCGIGRCRAGADLVSPPAPLLPGDLDSGTTSPLVLILPEVGEAIPDGPPNVGFTI